ncbi:MAG TPA: hypothetical protein VFG27_06760 [Pseudomonadales bacterium]|nr:hypothetical protein [Pseudomonadales bacterium]
MRRFVSPAILCFALTLIAACAPLGGSSPRSSGASVRCLNPGDSGGAGAAGSSESPDRPLFFLFCVQSP